LLLALLQRTAAERYLLQFQEHPQAWQRVDVILTTATNEATKFFALQVPFIPGVSLR
jgi:exportin-1